jgi:hypothetical protein
MTRRCSNSERLQFLREYCSGLNNTINGVEMRLTHRRMFYDDDDKILFCAIPKTGITSFKQLMMQIASKSPVHLEEGLHNLTILADHGIRVFTKVWKQEDKADKLKTFHKVVTVRHPVLRLIAAYKDKFFDKLYSERHNEHIIETYRREPVNPFSVYANRPTWMEFMRFVLEHEKSQADIHWMRYRSLCQPCVHRYNTIIKMETIDEDIQDFLKLFRGNYSYGHFNPSKGQHGKTLDDYMSELPKEMWQQLIDFYHTDFALFGYGVDLNRGKLFCDYSRIPIPSRNKDSTMSMYDDEDSRNPVPSCC